jgi:sulfite dehydrogenase
MPRFRLRTVRWYGIVLGVASLLPCAFAQAQTPDPAQLAEGKLLFQKQANPACATCHTLKDAGSTGAIGPNLDDTGPSKDDIRGVLHSGLGAMPQFDDHLSKDQIDALVNYVFWATHPH